MDKTHAGKLDQFAGQTVDPAAGDSSPPAAEVKPTEPEQAPRPTFDINTHNLSIAVGVKAAAAELIAVLTAHPQEERPAAAFLGSSGVMEVEAMRAHGLALEVKKIEALGISLPPGTEATPGFIGGKKGAAA